MKQINISEYNSIFFSGIGGISISAVAFILAGRGYKVSGSDIVSSPMTQKLEDAGIRVAIGHAAENVGDAQLFVYNARIKEDNPEMMAAREKGIPCVTRAQMIGVMMQDVPCPIGIAGTHGKSTATAMAGQVFLSANADPTILIGADYAPIAGTYRVGSGEHFIFEACEYTDSFLSFFPKIAVILNVEMDHPDYFKDISQMIDSFRRFTDIAGKDGYAVVNADSFHALESVKDYEGTICKFSLSDESCDVYAKNLRYENCKGRFELYQRGEKRADISLSVPGEFNVSNALAVCAAALICGIDGEAIARGLSEFRGTAHRFEMKGTYNGADVIDDYAHHPTAVEATLRFVKMMDYKRVWCIFQPHTYTRTKDLLDEFAGALRIADIVILPDIYTATEKDVYGVSSRDLADKIEGAMYIPSFAEIEKHLRKEVRPGDLVLTMGAGLAYKIADALIK